MWAKHHRNKITTYVLVKLSRVHHQNNCSNKNVVIASLIKVWTFYQDVEWREKSPVRDITNQSAIHAFVGAQALSELMEGLSHLP
jgi:hypothetical protein